MQTKKRSKRGALQCIPAGGTAYNQQQLGHDFSIRGGFTRGGASAEGIKQRAQDVGGWAYRRRLPQRPFYKSKCGEGSLCGRPVNPQQPDACRQQRWDARCVPPGVRVVNPRPQPPVLAPPGGPRQRGKPVLVSQLPRHEWGGAGATHPLVRFRRGWLVDEKGGGEASGGQGGKPGGQRP